MNGSRTGKSSSSNSLTKSISYPADRYYVAVMIRWGTKKRKL